MCVGELSAEPEGLAFQIADRYVSIQKVDGGYDYSIMGTDYKEIDGGLYDDPEITIREALEEIITDLKTSPGYNGAKGEIQRDDDLMSISYDELMKKVEDANQIV